MNKLRIRHVHPNDLQPAPYNPRTWTDEELHRLKTGLLEFGIVQPSIINTRTGWLVGGHMRRQACLELVDEGHTQFASVPIVEQDLDPERERALNILLNNPNAQGSFGADLTDVLDDLADTPLLELTGFTFNEYQQLQAETADDLKAGREGTTPAPPKNPITQPGQTWRLGRHLLHIGDATRPASYQHLPQPAAMCFTDPPYNVDYTGRTREELEIINDAWKTEAQYSAFIEDACTQIKTNTTGAIYMCYAISHAAAVHAAWENTQLHISTTIAWVKDRWVLSRSDYHNQWEGILYGWTEGQPHYFVDDRTQGNVLEYARPRRDDTGPKPRPKQSDVWRHNRPAASRLHPTMKPVALVEHAIRNSSHRNDWILDPFGGSGSTLIAAENIGRNAYLIELDPAYADVIIARYASISDTDPEEIP